MRKTKKYYKETVKGIFPIIPFLKELVNKFGKNPVGKRKRKELRIPQPSSFWNHYIEDFHYYNDELFASIYWQGDDTDGYDVIKINSDKINYVIPSESYFDGYRTRTLHSDLNVTNTEICDAIKRFVNSL